MARDMSYAKAMKNAKHLLALGQDTVYIDDDSDAPWDKATEVECGGTYRFDGPVNFYVIAHDGGLTFKWSVDMEKRDANGRGVSWFDKERLAIVARKLPTQARLALAAFLAEKVLPDLTKRTGEIRAALDAQFDSERCVRDLIELAARDAAA